MAGIADSIVQSDVPEKVATGIEGFYQGAFPAGVNNLAEEALGGAKPEEIQARADAHPGINKVGKLAGTVLRDTVMTGIVGPAALIGNAIANTIGNTADQAANYDPNLSVESVTSNLMSEMIGAGAAYIGGKAIGGLLGSGKYLTQAARKTVQGVFGSEASGLTSAAEDALEQGVFSTARKTARANALETKAGIQEKLDGFLKLADTSAESNVIEGNKGVQGLFAREVQETHEALGVSSKAVKTELKGIVRELQGSENLKPSEMLEVEGRIRDAKELAVKNDDVVAAGAVDKLLMRTQGLTNDFLARHGVSPDQVREIEQQVFAQDHVLSMIPKGDVVKSAAKLALRAPIVAAARATGIPGAGYMAAAALGRGGAAEARDIGKGVIGLGAQAAYSVGKKLDSTLGEFDRGIFGHYMAQVAQQGAKNAALSALSDDPKPSRVQNLPDHVLPTLQDYESNPQMFLKHLQDKLDAAPLNQTDKNAAYESTQKAMQYLQMNKPRPANPSPLAPPGARAVSKADQITFHQKLRGLTDPNGTLANPTQVGVDAVRVLHPSTYTAYVQEILKHVGPNTKSNAKARKLVNTLGIDHSMSVAGNAIQSQYLPTQPKQSGAGRPSQKVGDKINLSVVNSSSTAIDKVEASEQ